MEKPNTSGSNTFIVGLFVTLGFLVSSVFVVFMGGTSLFGGETKVTAIFEDVSGLNVGAPVFYSGLQVGRVSAKAFPELGNKGVIVELSLYDKDVPRIAKDSSVEIATQGMLGDKAIMISANGTSNEAITAGQRLEAKEAKALTEYLAKGENIVESVNQLTTSLNALVTDLHRSGRLPSILKNIDELTAGLNKNFGKDNDDLRVAMKSLRSVLTKVDEGKGTLGALVNDSSLHEDMRILLGGAQRSKIVRFMLRQAISAGEGQEIQEAPPSKKK
ncbi:MAG TPA: MlaD family protein [Bdellovibrionota bacterium]|jgi:phospholipid/cholesterol/gamma-HCH transport system substrate-binding protein|nr:MlaD family protein [Bdellovibrionota bacterium]